MTRRDAKTVLLADDDRDLVNALSVRCRRMGLKVLTAHDAFTALALVRSKCPDLICLDVEMPAGNGLSVCEMLTSDNAGQNIPIVIMTGRSDPDTICRCHNMCAYYVEKCPDIWHRIEPLLQELLNLPAVHGGSEQSFASPTPSSGALATTSAPTPAPRSPTPLMLSPSIPSPPIVSPAKINPLAVDSLTNSSDDDQPDASKSFGSLDTSHGGSLTPAMPSALTAPNETKDTASHDLGESSETQPAECSTVAKSCAPSDGVWHHFSQVMGRVVGRSDTSPEKEQAGSVPSSASAAIADAGPLAVAVADDTAAATGKCLIPSNEAAPVAVLDDMWASGGTTRADSQHSNGNTPSNGTTEETPMAKQASPQAEKTVLIADDDCDLVQMLVLRCTQLGLRVFRSPDAMHALLGVHRIRPDLLILDVNMPGGNGLSVCEMLASDESLNRIPVIIMTADANEEIPQRCQMLGAHFLAKSAGLWEQLEPLIRQSLGLPAPALPANSSIKQAPGDVQDNPVRILCIDDDPEISKILKIRLERYGVDVLRAFNGMQGYWTALDMRPNMIIMDMVMPDGGGNYIFGRLKSHPLTEKTPVLMLTGVNTPGVRRQMFGMGVDAYLTKPIDFEALLEHVRQYVSLTEPGSPRPGSSHGDASDVTPSINAADDLLNTRLSHALIS